MEKGGIIKYNKNNAPKTGDWRFMKPEVDNTKCIGCGTCVSYCPEAVIELKKKIIKIKQLKKLLKLIMNIVRAAGFVRQSAQLKQ